LRAHAPEREGTPLARVFGAWLLLMSAIAMLALLVWACAALGKASHEGWPRINGVLLMNSHDESRPLTGRPNAHNELLGGHGSDTIVAGQVGDVIWGDYKPCCQPTTQVDHLYGGPGRDHIYASHGINTIRTGGGRDVVHAHFGRGGEIHCESANVMLYISHRSRKRYRLYGCKRISYKTERMRRAERR
jgi:hypothetical protein